LVAVSECGGHRSGGKRGGEKVKFGFTCNLQDVTGLTEVQVGTVSDDMNAEEGFEIVRLGYLVGIGAKEVAQFGDEGWCSGRDGEVVDVDAEEDLLAVGVLFVEETGVMGGARVGMGEKEVGELIVEGLRSP